MGRTRFLVSAAAFALTLSLVVVDANAISLPDTASPCSTGSSDGCLKITNTDTADYGAPALYAVSQSPFSTAINANGNYYGITATGGAIGVSATGPSVGLYGSSASGTGVQGTSSSSSGTGVYGSSSGSTGTGVYGSATGGGYAVKAVATGFGVGIQASGFLALDATGNNTGISASGGVYGVSGSSSNIGVYGSSSGAGYGVYGNNTNSSGWAGYFNGKVFASAGYTSSDARLKKDVVGLAYGLKDISALRPVSFKWKDPSRGDERNIGFIAQDLQKIVPELVNQDSKSGMLAVNYTGLVPVLVKSIQEQQAIIARQEARIQVLEQRPLVSSMFSGGLDRSVAIGALCALVLAAVRRRKGRSETP
jgi:hypothetical protein